METTPVIIQAPASKSMSHRTLIAAALAAGQSRLTSVLKSEDLERTGDILSRMGAKLEYLGPGEIQVTGMAGRPEGGQTEPLDLFVAESGTTCRLLTAIAAAGKGKFRIHGRGQMHNRPIGALAQSLAKLGSTFTYEENQGCPPFILETNGMAGGNVDVDLAESSQYLSGVLLAAPMAADTLIVNVAGDKVVSWPYVALTLQVLEDFGIAFLVETRDGSGNWNRTDWREIKEVKPGSIRFVVSPGAYKAQDRRVEGDWSNASYFAAAGAIGPRPVIIEGLRRDSLQGDRVILDILQQMGADVQWQGDSVTISPGELKGVDVDMGACPDIVPTVAVAASLAQGETLIRNVAHLRIKECDRLSAVATELGRVGVQVDVLEDGLRVHPSSLPQEPKDEPIPHLTYGDHRIAMCMAILALAGETMVPDKPDCVGKSFPGFWDEWGKVVAGE
ncbi:MAG: 3-phosphoshikimate 1-carboxyvinyltransferase [Desulfovibrio sp.]|nr:MAG: 3-phosphoshikimate 1-carboxyvinyltransferase [Desulfovibrio sp.]